MRKFAASLIVTVVLVSLTACGNKNAQDVEAIKESVVTESGKAAAADNEPHRRKQSAVYNVGAALYRSIGKPSVTMYIAVVSNVINVVGNLIGVFVLRAVVFYIHFRGGKWKNYQLI